MKKVLTLFLVFAIIGCAAKMTREESLAKLQIAENARRQVFTNIEKEELIKVAEDALMSLEDNYVLYHNPDGFSAERRWLAYLVITAAFGVDHFSFTVIETEEGLIAESMFVDGASSSSGAGMGFDVGGGMSVTTPTGQTYAGMKDYNYNKSPELYELFYSRINFILGNSPEYVRCKDLKNSAKGENGLFPLCYVPSESFPEYANQPQEVFDYYIEFKKYERELTKKRDESHAPIEIPKPIKPWSKAP